MSTNNKPQHFVKRDRTALKAIRELQRKWPDGPPSGVTINPTRGEFEAYCREIGVDPPTTIPENGWRSRIFMSVAMLSRVWKQSKSRRNELLVLLAIADFANDDGEAWPSIKTLAAKSRLCERETRYALRRLEHTGEIKTRPAKGKAGCNLYRIIVSEPEGHSVQGGTVCRGTVMPQGGAQLCPSRGGTLVPPNHQWNHQ